MTKIFETQTNGNIIDTAVSSQDGVVSFYQLVKEPIFDEETNAFRDSYACFLLTVADCEIDFALVRDVASEMERAKAMLSLLAKCAVTPTTVFDVIEDLLS